MCYRGISIERHNDLGMGIAGRKIERGTNQQPGRPADTMTTAAVTALVGVVRWGSMTGVIVSGAHVFAYAAAVFTLRQINRRGQRCNRHAK